MNEFVINKYLSLKLENNKTNIYIKGIKYLNWKYILIDIPVENITKFENINSIDDVIETHDEAIINTKKKNYTFSAIGFNWSGNPINMIKL